MGYHWEPLQRRESVLKVTFQLVVNRRNAKSFTCFVFLSGEVAGKSNTLLLLNVSLSGKGRGIPSWDLASHLYMTRTLLIFLCRCL